MRVSRRLWHAAIRKTSLIMLPLFAFLMLMADSVVHVLYGSAFAGSVPIFRAYLSSSAARRDYALITQAVGKTLDQLLRVPRSACGERGVRRQPRLPARHARPGDCDAARLGGRRRVLPRAPPVGPRAQIADLLPWRLLLANLGVSFAAAAPLLALFAVPLSPFVRLALGASHVPPGLRGRAWVTGRLTRTDGACCTSSSPPAAAGR